MGDAEDGDCEEIEEKGGDTRGPDGIGVIEKKELVLLPAPFSISVLDNEAYQTQLSNKFWNILPGC